MRHSIVSSLKCCKKHPDCRLIRSRTALSFCRLSVFICFLCSIFSLKSHLLKFNGLIHLYAPRWHREISGKLFGKFHCSLNHSQVLVTFLDLVLFFISVKRSWHHFIIRKVIFLASLFQKDFADCTRYRWFRYLNCRTDCNLAPLKYQYHIGLLSTSCPKH